MINLEPRTIEILAQVTFKEMMEHARNDKLVYTDKSFFWKDHLECTLELARNIIRLNKQINP